MCLVICPSFRLFLSLPLCRLCLCLCLCSFVCRGRFGFVGLVCKFCILCIFCIFCIFCILGIVCIICRVCIVCKVCKVFIVFIVCIVCKVFSEYTFFDWPKYVRSLCVATLANMIYRHLPTRSPSQCAWGTHRSIYYNSI